MRKLLGLIILLLALFGVAWWVLSPKPATKPARCEGIPVLLTHQKREALFCVASNQPQSLVEAANISSPCKEALSSASPLQNAEHITLTQEGDSCQIARGDIPATQRFMLGLPLDLNTATAQDLETLPGVGPSVANAIIEDRKQNGAFQRIEELDRVKGIGPKLLEKLRPFVTVSPK